MTFSALFVDLDCQSSLALRQTSQLLAGHFDTAVSISGEVSVKPKTLRGRGEIADRRSDLFFYFYANAPFFSSLDGEKMDLRGRDVPQ